MSTGAAHLRRVPQDFRPLKPDESGIVRVPARRALVVNADGTLETVDRDAALGLVVYRDSACGECGKPHPERRYTVRFAHGERTDQPADKGTFVLVEGCS